MENFINKPIENDLIYEDIKAVYNNGIDVKTLSRQYLLPVSEIKKVVKESK